jgi:hypothetical protein
VASSASGVFIIGDAVSGLLHVNAVVLQGTIKLDDRDSEEASDGEIDPFTAA